VRRCRRDRRRRAPAGRRRARAPRRAVSRRPLCRVDADRLGRRCSSSTPASATPGPGRPPAPARHLLDALCTPHNAAAWRTRRWTGTSAVTVVLASRGYQPRPRRATSSPAPSPRRRAPGHPRGHRAPR
jgi:hypothetical protein